MCCQRLLVTAAALLRVATHLECAWQQADAVACQGVCEAGLAAAVEQLHACLAALRLVLAVNIHDQLRHEHTSKGAKQQARFRSAPAPAWCGSMKCLSSSGLLVNLLLSTGPHAQCAVLCCASLWPTHRHGCHTSAWVLVGGLVEEQHLVAANTCAGRGTAGSRTVSRRRHPSVTSAADVQPAGCATTRHQLGATPHLLPVPPRP